MQIKTKSHKFRDIKDSKAGAIAIITGTHIAAIILLVDGIIAITRGDRVEFYIRAMAIIILWFFALKKSRELQFLDKVEGEINSAKKK
jgi:hypothetical protein